MKTVVPEETAALPSGAPLQFLQAVGSQVVRGFEQPAERLPCVEVSRERMHVEPREQAFGAGQAVSGQRGLQPRLQKQPVHDRNAEALEEPLRDVSPVLLDVVQLAVEGERNREVRQVLKKRIDITCFTCSDKGLHEYVRELLNRRARQLSGQRFAQSQRVQQADERAVALRALLHENRALP